MKLRTISASGYSVAELCMVRYKAEYIDRTPKSEGSPPADLGTAVHGALEDYVKTIFVQKLNLAPTLKNLLMFFNKHFEKTFGSADRSNEWYAQGKEQLTTWFKRTDLTKVEVISTEKYDSIEVDTSQGIIKYNYIWDRCDMFFEDGKKIIRVVDYKTWRKNLDPKSMKGKVQVKMYAVAAAIQFKEAAPDEIWIQLDQLRYGNPEVKFTREELVETWRYIKRQAEIIIEADPEKLEPKLNEECCYCVVKTSCNLLRKNIIGGGVFSIADDDDLLASRLQELDAQAKGAESAANEIRSIMQAKMDAEDLDAWETENFTVEFTKTRRRQANSREVSLIVGPDVFRQIGKVSVAEVDSLIKSGELGPDATEQLKKVYTTTVSTKPVSKKKVS